MRLDVRAEKKGAGVIALQGEVAHAAREITSQDLDGALESPG
jgi:hypothetical protein